MSGSRGSSQRATSIEHMTGFGRRGAPRSAAAARAVRSKAALCATSTAPAAKSRKAASACGTGGALATIPSVMPW
jgi:hypothetical protein